MATCKKCGALFKPYWKFTEVENDTCEQCSFEESRKKGPWMVTALINVVLGIICTALSVFVEPFFFRIAGFIFLLFALLPLIEMAVLSRKDCPQHPCSWPLRSKERVCS